MSTWRCLAQGIYTKAIKSSTHWVMCNMVWIWKSKKLCHLVTPASGRTRLITSQSLNTEQDQNPVKLYLFDYDHSLPLVVLLDWIIYENWKIAKDHSHNEFNIKSTNLLVCNFCTNITVGGQVNATQQLINRVEIMRKSHFLRDMDGALHMPVNKIFY